MANQVQRLLTHCRVHILNGEGESRMVVDIDCTADELEFLRRLCKTFELRARTWQEFLSYEEIL